MAKGQKRSNREKKKPKRDKKAVAAAPSPISFDRGAKQGRSDGRKK